MWPEVSVYNNWSICLTRGVTVDVTDDLTICDFTDDVTICDVTDDVTICDGTDNVNICDVIIDVTDNVTVVTSLLTSRLTSILWRHYRAARQPRPPTCKHYRRV